MIKTKHLGFIAIASTALLFSGCVHQPDTFSNNNGYYNNAPRVNVALVSYGYPYYYDRPYYFFNGLYYYGGYYRNGFYYYGDRRFKNGHYYHRDNRYYNGRRYTARNGVYGYYKSRAEYQRSSQYKKVQRTKQRSVDRGRVYNSRSNVDNTVRRSHVGTRQQNVRSNDRSTQRSTIKSQRTNQVTSRNQTTRSSDRSTSRRSTGDSQSSVESTTRTRTRPVR